MSDVHEAADTVITTSGGAVADLESRLAHLERLVRDAKAVPLSASIMLPRDEAESVVAGLRASLPEQVRQARWVVKERDDILEQARNEAGRLVDEAQHERQRLIARTEVIQAANREADRLVEEARETARQIRLEAEDYVDAKLANFEVVLHKTLAAVERGREKLRGQAPTDVLRDDDDEE